ncbi:12804_t:CDS:2 [Funneliformis caledonium]|uniref:12804_t:CDS:1 n=1 Tax=Funneliformis caledonium TaxID=1117310 RepID=A0A9N9AEL4_9GLOM|nr:12804_t:CDS:2 [Funneliformis caledonium]
MSLQMLVATISRLLLEFILEGYKYHIQIPFTGSWMDLPNPSKKTKFFFDMRLLQHVQDN